MGGRRIIFVIHDGFDRHDEFLNLFHKRKKRVHNSVYYSMSNPSWSGVRLRNGDRTLCRRTRRPASGLCSGLELSANTFEMFYITTSIMRIRAAKSVYLKRLRNETTVVSTKSGHRYVFDTSTQLTVHMPSRNTTRYMQVSKS